MTPTPPYISTNINSNSPWGTPIFSSAPNRYTPTISLHNTPTITLKNPYRIWYGMIYHIPTIHLSHSYITPLHRTPISIPLHRTPILHPYTEPIHYTPARNPYITTEPLADPKSIT